MYNSPYKGIIDCVVKTTRKEGFKAFYRSYFTQLNINIPFQCTHLLAYDFLQTNLNKKREYNPVSHCISGAIAGGLAAAVTTPLDVCKTLINTQECCNPNELCKKGGVFTSGSGSGTSGSTSSSSGTGSGSAQSSGPPTLKTKPSFNINAIVNATGFVRAQSTTTGMMTASGLRDAVWIIYRAEGARGFFKGIMPRTVFQIPGTAVSWSVYEYFKHTLKNKSETSLSH